MSETTKKFKVGLRPKYNKQIEDHLRKENGLTEDQPVWGMGRIIRDIVGKACRGELRYPDGREYFG